MWLGSTKLESREHFHHHSKVCGSALFWKYKRVEGLFPETSQYNTSWIGFFLCLSWRLILNLLLPHPLIPDFNNSLPGKSESIKFILYLLRTRGLTGEDKRLFRGYYVFCYFSGWEQEFLNPKRDGKYNRTERDILGQRGPNGVPQTAWWRGPLTSIREAV